jgi:hypothetical protein
MKLPDPCTKRHPNCTARTIAFSGIVRTTFVSPTDLDRWITGNFGTDNDPETFRPAQPLRTGDTVTAAEDFDEFAQIWPGEMTIVPVKQGDAGLVVSEAGGCGTVAVTFGNATVEVWPHQIMRAGP